VPLAARSEIRRGAFRQRIGVLLRCTGDLRGEIGDVVALITAFGHLVPARSSSDRFPQQPDLVARVVEVVLAGHRMPVVLQDPRQRVPVGGMTPAGGDQGASRVGGDELDEDSLRGIRSPSAHPLSGLHDLRQRPSVPGIRQEQVEEPGPSHLGPFKTVAQRAAELFRQPRGDHPGRSAEDRSEQHRGVGRIVPLAGIPGSLELGLGGGLAGAATDHRRGRAHGREELLQGVDYVAIAQRHEW
jgi:hypothetical protein